MSQNRYGCCFISRKRWKGGKRMEQEEWKQIYEIYQRPLFLYALSLTKNIQDAEDLLQETFIKAFLSYEKTGSIKYWLVTVLRNEFLNLYRKRKREILDGGNIQPNPEESEAINEQVRDFA